MDHDPAEANVWPAPRARSLKKENFLIHQRTHLGTLPNVCAAKCKNNYENFVAGPPLLFRPWKSKGKPELQAKCGKFCQAQLYAVFFSPPPLARSLLVAFYWLFVGISSADFFVCFFALCGVLLSCFHCSKTGQNEARRREQRPTLKFT